MHIGSDIVAAAHLAWALTILDARGKRTGGRLVRERALALRGGPARRNLRSRGQQWLVDHLVPKRRRRPFAGGPMQ